MTKLILACDVSTLADGINLIDKTAEHVDVVKIGLESMNTEDIHGRTLASNFRRHTLNIHNRDVMWDGKFDDVANTMSAASGNVVKYGSSYFTIHATVSEAALVAVTKAIAHTPVIPLAVTVLTDLDEPQCISLFGEIPSAAVVKFAKRAYGLGIQGFVCSPLEVDLIKQALPKAFVVTPGIRPEWAVTPDEQKRITTPRQAKLWGADAIVVGRPISKPPHIHTETSAARAIRQELDAA